MNIRTILPLFSLPILFLCPALGARLQVASPFTDHMVLQRGMGVPVWGKAEPGAEVIVEFAGQEQRAKVGQDGKWGVDLEPLEGNSKGRVMTIRGGKAKIQLSDVVVGEVWICSGQSNMQMGRGGVPGLQGLSEENLRTFEVKRTVAFTEQDELEGEWKVGGPGSAVAFGFAHHLAKRTDGLPVGILLSAWGSSSIEAWMPRDMVKDFPYFQKILAEQDANKEALAQIQAALDKGKWSGPDDVFMRRHSNILYNAMIHPLVPYACRGLVWYQGERNTRYISGMPDSPWYHRVAGIQEYDDVLKAWMQRYRTEWGREDFHFLVVMLPGFGSVLPTGPTKDANHPASHSWAWMRESQLAALELPHTGVANTIDLGDVKNIHPRDKEPVGHRLALLAARDTLGQGIEASGPVFERLEKKGNQLVVHFKHSAGLKTTNGSAPAEFWLAGEEGKWEPAQAKVVGQTVVLGAAGISQPAHVRYAFTGKPSVNLVNGAGLPAYPFRTDTFAP
jgi:sialate O-acetylesterase